MPGFKLLDHLNTSLLDVAVKRDSGIGKYLPDSAVRLLALRPAAQALGKRLSESPTEPVVLEFTTPETVAIGGAGDLSLDAGVRATVGVHQADELLFPADDLRDAVSVPSGTAYVSAGLQPRVAASLQGQRGPLAFGFSAGGSLSVRFFQPVDTVGADPTLADALAHTLQAAVLPGEVDDLAALPAGAFVSIEGEGELQLSGSVELASVTNPLATPSLPVIGAASVTAGASARVKAEWTASGAFELRVARLRDGRVRLSYYKRTGSQVSVTASASVGVSAHIRDSDAIVKLLGAISSDPEADLVELVNAGLSDAQIEALQKAVTLSVDRSIRASAEMEFSSVRRGEALFAYDFDPAALSPSDRTAVEQAIRGRLGAIGDAAASGDGPIRLVQTGMLRRRERRVTWRINLFGILNVRSAAELLRKGTLTYDPVTGTLNAADEIASERILVSTRPFEADGEKVRKLVFESMIVTAAYHASRVTSGVAVTCSSSYFEAHRKTDSRDMREHYNAILALGLADAQERDRRIGQEHDFGASTFLLECRFDQNAADRLFLGPQGPFTRDDYERVGRDAMLALIPAGDAERAHRRAALEDDASWAALVEMGPAAARFDLERKLGAVRAGHIISDYLVIRWWSGAMHDAARALLEMRQFLGGRSAQSLANDAEFGKRRDRLERELAGVVKESKAQFGDPWGILALDAAAGRSSAVQATLVSPRLTAIYDTRVLPPPTVGRASATPAARRGLQEAREARRPFTAEERELLRRHAINLRLGALSSDGEFATSEADVQRLFTELLPAEIEERRAAGQKMRLLFYAHGGLIGEREGLEPVLARLKFWRLNGIYPVSFVWETGLRETITDILKGLIGTRDMVARGIGEDLADAVIEVAARQGGKTVWGQMKRSAELAVLPGGGGAEVASLTRDLWNAHHDDMEIHAAGHSAGSIFHAWFLPALLDMKGPAGVPKLAIRTFHLLAPACTTTLFEDRLLKLIGRSKPIDALTMYTMNKSLELEDTAGPYHKSLLYLVSRSFETEQPAPILGLEESLRQDLKLIRFFGLAGNQKTADVLFSKTPPGAPLRSRTSSTSHGGFDDDPDTMNSLMRRMLDVPDTTPIVDFFQEPIEARAAGGRAGEIIAARIQDVPPPGGDPVAAAPPDVPQPIAAVSVPALAPPVHAATAGQATAPALNGGTPAGTRRALCVGIDKYGPPYDLAGCVNDALNWASALQAQGFDVTTLRDGEASRQAILAALGGMVAAANPGDVIVFQYAGHGTQVDDLDSEEDDSLDEAFCPVDFADGHLLIDDDIRAVVAGLRAGVNLTCFIDCCHSGTITRALVPGSRPGAIPAGSRARYIPYSKTISELHRRFRESGGADVGAPRSRGAGAAAIKEVCFSACQPHEVAYETAGAGQFTTRAVAALKADAALTNEAFMQRVVTAFGPNPAQHPYLDCAADARGRGLLRPLVMAGAGL